MIIGNYENLLSPIRTIKGKVELLGASGSATTSISGETIANPTDGAVYTSEDALKEFTIDRTGESGKLFGFGVVQKLETKFVDREREINITKGKALKVSLATDENYISPCPIFYTEDPKRDEKTNELTITAYDKLNAAAAHTVSELNLQFPYTIGDFAAACAALLGVEVRIEEDESFNTSYETGANFEGTEKIRDALNAIAEATQTIYYLDYTDTLVFKRLTTLTPDLFIDKTQYMELSSEPEIILSDITHATELGDNLTASTGSEGVEQIVRDNPFWELREDLSTLLDNAAAAIDGILANPMEATWRGNYFLEIGDRLAFTNKDDSGYVTCYLLNDTLTYNGGFSQKTKWEYKVEESETASNPTSLGDVIKQTFAKVDKANKQIDLVVSETDGNSAAISTLQMDTEGLIAAVSTIETVTNEAIAGANEEIATLKKSVEAQMTNEDVTLAIKQELDNGVAKVTTAKGFVFNDEGLTIKAVDEEGNRVSETSTTISENGMQVFDNNDEAVLTANNAGVNAVNLHATTYLIVGNNSRFEDYGTDRTGCFWIGGNS